MTDLHVTQANIKHINGISHIIKSSFNSLQSTYTAVGQRGYRKYLRDFISQKDQGPKRLLVAISDMQIVAFADVSLKQNEPNFLTRIAVHPNYRGQKIASRLMRSIQESYDAGDQWELDVFQSNTGARRFYELLGFEMIETKYWIGRCLPAAQARVEHGTEIELSEDADFYYDRYGFTTLNLQGHKVSVAGTAIRCYDVADFANDDYLLKIQKKFPQADRAFIILNEEAGVRSYLPKDVFKIDRSLRLRGTF